MTAVQIDLETIIGTRPASSSVTFVSDDLRPEADGSAVVVPSRHTVDLDAGVGTSGDLDPGVYTVEIVADGEITTTPDVAVPAGASVPLKLVLALTAAAPGSRDAAVLAAAVAAYLEDNPVTAPPSELDPDEVAAIVRETGDGRYLRPAEPNIDAWRRKYALRETRPVRIVTIPGDSWAAPYGASEPDRGWFSLVADDLGGGDSGRSISPTGPHSVQRSAGVEVDDNRNPHMATLTGEQVVTFYDLDRFSTIDVFYLRVQGGDTPAARPQFSIDGGPWRSDYTADLDLFSPGTSYRWGRIVGLNGSTLALRPDPATPRAHIYPIIARRGRLDRGIEWINWAQPGWTASRFMAIATGWAVAEPLIATPADVLHVQTGGNEANNGESVANMLNELGNFLSLYRAQIAPSCAIVATLMPWPDASVSEAAWNERMDAIAELVRGYGGFVIDWRRTLVRQSAMTGLVTSPTDFHLSDAGHRYVADIVAAALSR